MFSVSHCFISHSLSFQVTVKYGDKYRSRIIKASEEKAICKALYNNRKPETILQCVTKLDKYKTALVESICKILSHEVSILCRNEETLLRYNNDIKWNLLSKELKDKAPCLYEIAETVVLKNKRNGTEGVVGKLCTGLSVLLYSRNNKLSQVQHIIGFILDQCGTTKEV